MLKIRHFCYTCGEYTEHTHMKFSICVCPKCGTEKVIKGTAAREKAAADDRHTKKSKNEK